MADVRFRKVVAIIRAGALKAVEEKLRELRVPGITVSKVKGYGQHANFFTSDWMVENARIEIFATRERADEIARAIVEAAHAGLPGDGLVIVHPVEAVYRIRSKQLATSEELG